MYILCSSISYISFLGLFFICKFLFPGRFVLVFAPMCTGFWCACVCVCVCVCVCACVCLCLCLCVCSCGVHYSCIPFPVFDSFFFNLCTQCCRHALSLSVSCIGLDYRFLLQVSFPGLFSRSLFLCANRFSCFGFFSRFLF